MTTLFLDRPTLGGRSGGHGRTTSLHRNRSANPNSSPCTSSYSCSCSCCSPSHTSAYGCTGLQQTSRISQQWRMVVHELTVMPHREIQGFVEQRGVTLAGGGVGCRGGRVGRCACLRRRLR